MRIVSEARGEIIESPAPYLIKGPHANDRARDAYRSQSRRQARISDRRKKLIKVIPAAIANYAACPHNPERVEISGIPDDLFTRRRSQVKDWLQVALDDWHWHYHVVVYTPTKNKAGEIVPKGAKDVPRLAVHTEWEEAGNTLLVSLFQVMEINYDPPPGAISFDEL